MDKEKKAAEEEAVEETEAVIEAIHEQAPTAPDAPTALDAPTVLQALMQTELPTPVALRLARETYASPEALQQAITTAAAEVAAIRETGKGGSTAFGLQSEQARQEATERPDATKVAESQRAVLKKYLGH